MKVPIIPSFTLGGDDLTPVIPKKSGPHTRAKISDPACPTLASSACDARISGVFLGESRAPKQKTKQNKLGKIRNEILLKKEDEEGKKMMLCRSVTDLRFKGVDGLA